MRKILSIILMIFIIAACVTSCSKPNSDSDGFDDSLNNEIEDGDTGDNTDEPAAPNDPEAPGDTENSGEPDTPDNTDTPDDTENPGDSETSDGTENPDGSETPTVKDVIINVEKTADEMAASIDKYTNGDIVSGEAIKLDKNITASFGKGTANTEPALYSGSIRIYQNGGTLVVTALNDRILKTIVITTSDSKTGNGKLKVDGGELTVNGDVLTINVYENAKSVTITVGGSEKSDRLYVEALEVIYIGKTGDENTESDAETKPEGDNSTEDDGNLGTDAVYSDFTAEEKSSYLDYVGFVIPFLPNDDYYIEAYDEDGYRGVYYSAKCNTYSEFTAYRELYSSYTYDGTETDGYADTWYLYSKGSVYVDICYYEYDGSYYVDVDAYSESDNSSNTNGDNNTESEEGGSGDTKDADVITNASAGLPEASGDGIYNVDLTAATNVKDVTDQGYYLDGCPTVGSPGVLVIPVDFSDATAASKGYSIDKIVNAFSKDGVTDYYSVYDYYYISSYGKLELDITVLDSWFRPANTSTYYASQTLEYYGSETVIGDQMIIDEALAYLEDIMDLSQFDSDNNGTIDSVVLITTLDINSDEVFYWAYRYWNIYTDNDGYYYEYDGVSANDYLWAPYQFLYETNDALGNPSYDDTDATNTYTFIHEFGHILGADDYYDTAGLGSPMDGFDIMDAMRGDHNAYTKFNYGWLTSSRLVVTDGSVTLSLEDFSKSGDTIIIANIWNPELGVYQEYYIVVYYTNNGLNSGDENGYFDRSGIIVYHVNASLYRDEYDGEVYYDVYNNNTDPSDSVGTENNLIEFVTTDEGNYTYIAGDSLGNVTDDEGNALAYTFYVEELTDEAATVTFTRK